MAKNKLLTKAKLAKNDEFYTQLADIENECKHYKEHFKNKIIFCNCDDPYESNFFKYFAMNFNHFGLKKLIATCYDGSPIAYTQLSFFAEDEKSFINTNKRAYKIEISEVKDYNGDGAVDLADVEYLLKNKKNTLTVLKENGDFRSQECVELLKECDIVVTNPPFLLFKEYVAQLIAYNKQFLIIGNMNAITYKEIFSLIISNKLWTGYSFNKTMEFVMPDNYKLSGKAYIDSNGKKHGYVPAVNWYTNIEIDKRKESFITYKTYNEKDYPKYDNYDAIEVSKVTDIPEDYYGIMGVPITFLNKYNPDEYEIVGMCENLDLYGLKTRVYTSAECKKRYFELFGKKGVYDLNAAGVINGVKVYQRLLIRRKQK